MEAHNKNYGQGFSTGTVFPDNMVYYQVRPSEISEHILLAGGLAIDERPAEIDRPERLSDQILLTEFALRHQALQPSDRLAQGVDFAKELVQHLRSSFGLKSVDPDQMEVLFLPEDVFDKERNQLGQTRSGSLGFAADVLEPVVVKWREDVPEYFTASIAMHELCHKWIDFKSRVIAVQKQDGKERLFTEARRSGLSINKRKGCQQGAFGRDRIGSLLNELGNYAVQYGFIKELPKNSSTRGVFEEELELRESYLQDQFGDDQELIIGAESQQIVLSRDVMHLESSGRPIFPGSFVVGTLAMQLIKDLNDVVDTPSTEPFWQKLLRSKVNPRVQNELRRVVDDSFGEGFYSHIKKTDESGIIPIMKVVQDKLYTIRERDI